MDVLVVGVSGLLGSNVVSAALGRGHAVSGTYHTESSEFDIAQRSLDIRNTSSFQEVLDSVDPRVVVNCAAMTDVDACERSPEQAHEINAIAPKRMAQSCSERNVAFVHVSTDYIFDGTSNERYLEEDDPNPIQVYGQSKLVGEQDVRLVHDSSLIIRPSFVYGVNRSKDIPTVEGFPAWVHSQLVDGEELGLFTDQYVTPSRAGNTAEAMLDLILAEVSGTYHIAAQSCITPLEFGRIIASELELRGQFTKSSLKVVDRVAERPSHTCLSVEKLETQLGRPQPSVAEDIRAITSHFSP
jgi:dTDP-4-dehydrorhamnose reductase